MSSLTSYPGRLRDALCPARLLACKTCLFLAALLLTLSAFFWTPVTLFLYKSTDVPALAQGGAPSEEYPQILHQIFFNYSSLPIPKQWLDNAEVCQQKFANFQYMLWDDEKFDKFLEKEYSWFVDTYRSYRYPVQRTDAARYFILLKYGGVYLDMDVYCKISWKELLEISNASSSAECMFPHGKPVGITSNIIACKANSPFLRFVTSQLSAYNRWYVIPYLSIELGTGPMFVSACYNRYRHNEDIHVLPYAESRDVYFTNIAGLTWMTWDGKLLNGIYDNTRRYQVFILLFLGLLIPMGLCRYAIRRRRLRNASQQSREEP